MKNAERCTLFRKCVLSASGLLLTAVLLPATASAQQGPPPATVKVDVASRQSIASTTLAPGTVISRNDANIAAEIPGRLISVREVGDSIAAGEPLAQIDDRALQLQLRDDNARIRRLEANLKFLASQTDRLRSLAQQNNAARNQLDESMAQMTMAEQDLVVARVDRDQTLYRISRSKVAAPFDGRIVERHAQAGEFVSVGAPVVRLVDIDSIEVQARAPMSVAGFLREGMQVTVRDGTFNLPGTLRAVVPVGDARSRLIEVRVSLDGGDSVIGSAVRVELPRSSPTEVVAVHRDALVLRQDATYLFRVNDDNTVEQIPVTTGIGQGSFIEVRGDINDGDKVVVRGGERLRPGQAVTIAQES